MDEITTLIDLNQAAEIEFISGVFFGFVCALFLVKNGMLVKGGSKDIQSEQLKSELRALRRELDERSKEEYEDFNTRN